MRKSALSSRDLQVSALSFCLFSRKYISTIVQHFNVDLSSSGETNGNCVVLSGFVSCAVPQDLIPLSNPRWR